MSTGHYINSTKKCQEFKNNMVVRYILKFQKSDSKPLNYQEKKEG